MKMKVLVIQSYLSPSRLFCLWTSSGKNRSGLPCPPPGDLSDPGVELRSPALQVESLLSEPPGEGSPPWSVAD